MPGRKAAARSRPNNHLVIVSNEIGTRRRSDNSSMVTSPSVDAPSLVSSVLISLGSACLPQDNPLDAQSTTSPARENLPPESLPDDGGSTDDDLQERGLD